MSSQAFKPQHSLPRALRHCALTRDLLHCTSPLHHPTTYSIHRQTTSTPSAVLTAISPLPTTISSSSNAARYAYETYTEKADNGGESAWESSVACSSLLMHCLPRCLTHSCGLKNDNYSSMKCSERIIKTEGFDKNPKSETCQMPRIVLLQSPSRVKPPGTGRCGKAK